MTAIPKIKKFFTAGLLSLSLVAIFCAYLSFVSVPTYAEPATDTTTTTDTTPKDKGSTSGSSVDPGSKSQICQGIGETGGSCDSSASSTSTIDHLVKLVINIFSVVVGILAVLMIVLAGFKFITAGGDSNAVASAKGTLMYALVGLIVVLLAQVIVNFVIGKVVGL